MTAVSRDGLVLECLLDGNANDTSGHDHHGVVHGAVPTTDRFGNAGGALLFDGQDDFVAIAPPPALNDQALSVSVWARHDGDEFAGWTNCVICQDNGDDTTDQSKRVFQLSTHAGRVVWHRMIQARDPTARHSVRPGKWCHIAVVFDGKVHRLYVDGLLHDSVGHCLWINAEEPVHIGRKGTAEPYFFFRGAIDDVRIYDRVLGVDEVRALLEDGGYRTPSSPGVDPISGIWGSGASGLLDLGFDGHRTVSGVVGSGSLNNPSAIKQGTFDSSTGVLKLEGEARRRDTGALDRYVIDGRLLGRTLTVHYAFAKFEGDLTLRKLRPPSVWRRRLRALGESLRSKIEPVLVPALRFLRGRKRPSRAANMRLVHERGESAAALIVREATREDIPALADLHVRTWNATYPGVRRPPTYEIRESQWREAFETPDGSWFCFVIENAQGQLVGFAKGVKNPDGSGGLNKIYLLRDYQRLGLGRRLVGHVTRRFLAQGISSMYVCADAGNPSCGFYEALGAVNTVDRSGRKNLGAYVWRDLPGLAAKLPD